MMRSSPSQLHWGREGGLLFKCFSLVSDEVDIVLNSRGMSATIIIKF